MKRIIVTLIMLGLGVVSLGIFEPVPEPVEPQPVLVSEAKQWDLTKAYYRKVKMPDGSRQELKSRTPLDAKQWEALAQKQWDAMKAIEESQPENCMDCHAGCGRKTS